jgi:hypothetical protein
MHALHMLTPQPGDAGAANAADADGSGCQSLDDLAMAIELAARHSPAPADTASATASDAVAAPATPPACLWHELKRRTSPAARVLVQYNQQLVQLAQGAPGNAPEDAAHLWQGLLSACQSAADGTTAAAGATEESQVLLRDAAAAVTNAVRSVSMHAEASTLQR